MIRYSRFSILLAAFAAVTACGILSKTGNRRNKAKIIGTMLIEQPVCDKSVAEKSSAALANTTWYIKHGKTNHPDSIAFDQFSTDEQGKFTLRLSAGDYAIVHKDKLMDFGEFRLKYSSDKSTYLKVRDEDCFRRWFGSADFVLHVANDTTVQLHDGAIPCQIALHHTYKSLHRIHRAEINDELKM
jgi:hypothetical protein